MGEGNLDLRAVPLDDYFAQITVGIARSRSHISTPIMEEFYLYTRQELGNILTEQCEEGQRIMARQHAC